MTDTDAPLVDALRLLGAYAWGDPVDQAMLDAAWSSTTNFCGLLMLVTRAGIPPRVRLCNCPLCVPFTVYSGTGDEPCGKWALLVAPATARRAVCDLIRRHHPTAPRIEELLDLNRHREGDHHACT